MAGVRQTALVLGGGIMGLSAAWALQRDGYAVTLVDQDSLPNPRGASCDQHRLIRHAYGAEAGYMRMVDEAFAAWDRLWDELGETLYVPTGVLALSDDGGGWLAASEAALRDTPLALELLGGEALAARFPMLSGAGLARAFLMREGGVLLAERILAALHRLVVRRGVRVLQAQATAVDAAGAGLHLAGGERLSAELLVIAAGPWAPRLLPEIAARVTASRQICVYLEPPETHRAAWAAAPMLLDLSDTSGFYAVPPVAGTALKIGDHSFSCRGTAEDAREASPAEVTEILDLARMRIAGLDRYRVVGARACYYDVTEGERFILEQLSPRCMVMSGFSGHGFKFGPLLGEAVAAAARDPASARSLSAWAAGTAPPPPGLIRPPALATPAP